MGHARLVPFPAVVLGVCGRGVQPARRRARRVDGGQAHRAMQSVGRVRARPGPLTSRCDGGGRFTRRAAQARARRRPARGGSAQAPIRRAAGPPPRGRAPSAARRAPAGTPRAACAWPGCGPCRAHLARHTEPQAGHRKAVGSPVHDQRPEVPSSPGLVGPIEVLAPLHAQRCRESFVAG